jgi:hypothetical protein
VLAVIVRIFSLAVMLEISPDLSKYISVLYNAGCYRITASYQPAKQPVTAGGTAR